MITRSASLFFGALLVYAGIFTLPLSIASAQEESQASILRSEIRSALLADPRAANITSSELEALIESLALEAEAQNVVSEFVPPPSPHYDSVTEFAYAIVTPWGQPLSPAALYGIVLVCLACAVVMLFALLRMHKHTDLR